MAKKDPVKKALDALREVDPRAPGGGEFLAAALGHKFNLVVKSAARKIAEHRVRNLSDEVASAFERFLDAGPEADKGCEAKTALASALCEMEVQVEELYLRGARLVQMEAAYGGPVDTAPELRGLCGVGLVRSGRSEVLQELAQLLADKEPVARVYAARAVTELGKVEGAALLRLRLMTGEDFPEVVLECLGGMFALSPEKAVCFVREHMLSKGDERKAPAILALGEARRADALEVLLEEFSRARLQSDRRAVLEAVAMSRLEAGLGFLLSLVEEHDTLAEEIVRQFWGEGPLIKS